MTAVSFWTDETIRDLRRLWARGDSCSQIGKVMGVSRNSIISKAHRLALPQRDKRTASPSAELLEHRRQQKCAGEKRRRQRKNILAFFSGDRTPPMEIVDKPVDVEVSPIAFRDLRPFSGNSVNQCRYVAAEPAGPDYFACGKPTGVGESWCGACKTIVFRSPVNVTDEDRERRANNMKRVTINRRPFNPVVVGGSEAA